MIDDLIAVALGLVLGLFSGVFGVGGSSIATPLLRVSLDTPRLLALASPLPVTLPAALAGSLAYFRQGVLNQTVIIWVVPIAVPAVVIGSLLTQWVPSATLLLLVAVVVGGVGVVMIRTPNPAPHTKSSATAAAALHPIPSGAMSHLSPAAVDARWVNPPRTLLLVIAAVVGLLSGLLANGGGFLLVPAFVIMFGATVREAAATSLVCVAFLAIPGTVTHALLGHIDWRLSLLLIVGVIPGTYVGARLSLAARRIRLRHAFGVFLVLFAIYFVIRELMTVA